ncbi:hypothetical protein FO440_11365 [Mucilaginibacter corticis]|uniref:Uncharacterized protein n=1 Tax=Mucilaginibacter corticis TaxID=2597670 RepID=A0A556MKB0_9SPHI|nr:hypothetical protein [Mucilaginibacter corticis]TSJ40351.1 hypothetical protein FO440_11365 [Mucilaginibacter corticis]
MSFKTHQNKITLNNGYSIDFEYPIKEALLLEDVIIILIEAPPKIIYNHNVFAISSTGDFLWRIGEVQLYYWGSNNCPYIGVELNNNNEVVLFNWCDTAVIIQPETGAVIRTYQTK